MSKSIVAKLQRKNKNKEVVSIWIPIFGTFCNIDMVVRNKEDLA